MAFVYCYDECKSGKKEETSKQNATLNNDGTYKVWKKYSINVQWNLNNLNKSTIL